MSEIPGPDLGSNEPDEAYTSGIAFDERVAALEAAAGGGSGGGLAEPMLTSESGGTGWCVETNDAIEVPDAYGSVDLEWGTVYPPGPDNPYQETAYDGEHFAWAGPGEYAHYLTVKTPGWYRVSLFINRTGDFSPYSHFSFKSFAEGQEHRFPFLPHISHAASLVTCVPADSAPTTWIVRCYAGEAVVGAPHFGGALSFMPLTSLP